MSDITLSDASPTDSSGMSDAGGGDYAPAPASSADDPVRYGEPQPEPSAPLKYEDVEPKPQPTPQQRPAPHRDRGMFAKRPEPLQAPQSWQRDVAERYWSKLEPDLQQYISERELQAHQAITQYGERVKSYEPIDHLLEQHRPTYERHGLDRNSAIAALFHAQQVLDNDPVQGILSLGRSYGIDLAPVLSGAVDVQQAHHAVQQWHAYSSGLGEQLAAAQQENAKLKTEFAAYRQKMEATEKAAGAAKAARLNVKSSVANPKNKTMEDTLEEIAARRYG